MNQEGDDSVRITMLQSNYHNPVSVVRATLGLNCIHVMTEKCLTDAVPGVNLEGRAFMRPEESVRRVTVEQVRLVIAIIPSDDWQICC